jgi:hypothetical protein
MAIVRRLTERGISEFREWLESKAPGEPPHHLLNDKATSAPLAVEVELEQKPFDTRYEFGVHLKDALQELDFATIAFDAGMWDWITLFHFDAIAPARDDGRRKLAEIARYSQDPGSRRWSRHVARMSWLSVRNHGEHAKYFLTSPLETHSDILEQIAGKQEVFGSATAVALGEWLYWDADALKPKKGAGGKGAGSPRRLSRFMAQIQMTYDPENMSVDQLAELLPVEFSRWKAPAKEKPRSALRRFFAGSDV